MTLNFGNQLFPPRGEPLLNFSFQDLIQDFNYATYYLAITNAGAAQIITPALISSNTSSSEFTTTSDSFTKLADMDFDILVNKPLHVKGEVITETTTITRDTGTNSVNVYLILKFRKWDGSSETELGNSQTRTNPGLTTADFFRRESNTITVDSHFKVGETIRLTVEVWGSRDAGGSNDEVGFYHDPISKSTAGTSPALQTSFKLFIPFRNNTFS